jgi:L-asparaginase
VPEFPRVLVIGLGGTIAMTAAAAGGVTPTLSAQQLLDAVPGLTDLEIDLDALSFRAKPGASLTIEDLVELIGVIREAFASDVAGVVITQGTDTIEETAYALDLLHSGPQPVVVTGAMRNPTLAGADGPANLLAAVTVAASPAARGLGSLVVMADEVHAASRVRKTHATSVTTFVSPNGGPLGHVVEGQVRILSRLLDRYALPDPGHLGSEPCVVLYTATLDDDGRILSAVAELADALVIAGFGVGHVPEPWVPTLAEAARRMPVVLTSRTGSGPALTSTYGFPGSERDLISHGLIPAGYLDPYKARILLRFALSAGADRDQISDAITTAGAVSASAWPWPPAVAAGRDQG